MKNMSRLAWIGVGMFCPLTWASDLVYTPFNPSFGGNPSNGAVLMQSAESQNRFTDPNARSSSFQTDPLQDFQTSLQRQALSLISQRILQEAFGTDTGLGQGGIYQTDDFTVEVDNTNPNNIVLHITQPGQAGVTTVTIPKEF